MELREDAPETSAPPGSTPRLPEGITSRGVGHAPEVSSTALSTPKHKASYAGMTTMPKSAKKHLTSEIRTPTTRQQSAAENDDHQKPRRALQPTSRVWFSRVTCYLCFGSKYLKWCSCFKDLGSFWGWRLKIWDQVSSYGLSANQSQCWEDWICVSLSSLLMFADSCVCSSWRESEFFPGNSKGNTSDQNIVTAESSLGGKIRSIWGLLWLVW